MTEQEPTTDELLPFKDAAERLGTTVPRLRRALARPGLASHVRTISRQTRTGTRTTQTVPESVLVLVAEALQNPLAPSSKLDSSHNAAGTETNENENEYIGNVPVPVIVPVPLTELISLKEAAAVSAKLAEDLERERAERKREQIEAADTLRREQEVAAAALQAIGNLREQQAAKLGAAFQAGATARELIPVASPDAQHDVLERPGDTHSDRSAEPDEVQEPAGPTAEVVAETMKRAEVAEGKLQVANDSLAREKAERLAAERALQALQDDAARPWWKKLLGVR